MKNKSKFEGLREDLLKYRKYIIYVALFFLTLYFCMFHFGFSSDNGDWGTFGDFFGGVLNPIVAFFSFTALMTTIGLQLEQMKQSEEALKLSRDELKLTREELARAATAQEDAKSVMDAQHKTQSQQQFESTFFAMLNQLNLLVERVSEKKPNQNKSIIDNVHFTIYMQFQNFNEVSRAKTTLTKNSEIKKIFMLIYQLFKLIDGKKEVVNSKSYTNIIRSFMSSDLLQLLLLNCACDDDDDAGFYKFRKFVEEYSFFEHMSFYAEVDGLTSLNCYYPLVLSIPFYDCSAFGKNMDLKVLLGNNLSGVSLFNNKVLFLSPDDHTSKILDILTGSWICAVDGHQSKNIIFSHISFCENKIIMRNNGANFEYAKIVDENSKIRWNKEDENSLNLKNIYFSLPNILNIYFEESNNRVGTVGGFDDGILLKIYIDNLKSLGAILAYNRRSECTESHFKLEKADDLLPIF